MSNRILSHNELANKGLTIKYRPWVITHMEESETKTETITSYRHPELFLAESLPFCHKA